MTVCVSLIAGQLGICYGMWDLIMAKVVQRIAKTRPRSWVTSHSKGFFNVLAANRQQNIAAIGRTTELTETFVAGCPWFFPISFALMRSVKPEANQSRTIPCNSSATFFLCPSTEWLLSESQQAENRQWSWKKDFLNKYILYFIILHLTIVFLSWCGLSIYGCSML